MIIKINIGYEQQFLEMSYYHVSLKHEHYSNSFIMTTIHQLPGIDDTVAYYLRHLHQ